jgi:hypothetical protein
MPPTGRALGTCGATCGSGEGGREGGREGELEHVVRVGVFRPESTHPFRLSSLLPSLPPSLPPYLEERGPHRVHSTQHEGS